MTDSEIYWSYAWQYEQLDFKYCPRCGSQLDLRDVHIPDQPQLICDSCKFILYLDPKVVVAAAVIYDDKVLLLKRAEEPKVGFWALPGGHTQRGKSIIETVKSEVLEETGYSVDIVRVIDFFDLPNNQGVQLTFEAQIIEGGLKINIESREGRFFGYGEIPWDELAFASTRKVLQSLTDENT